MHACILPSPLPSTGIRTKPTNCGSKGSLQAHAMQSILLAIYCYTVVQMHACFVKQRHKPFTPVDVTCMYMCRSALLHYFRIVVVDEDLCAPGSTFNEAERTQAHKNLFSYASMVQQVGPAAEITYLPLENSPCTTVHVRVLLTYDCTNLLMSSTTMRLLCIASPGVLRYSVMVIAAVVIAAG